MFHKTNKNNLFFKTKFSLSVAFILLSKFRTNKNLTNAVKDI